jgi:ABC-type tungstate transport system permease subunit
MKKEIMDKGLNSLLNLIKSTIFDKDKPVFHTYSVIALNDKHASVLDTNTQTIIKTEKNELSNNIIKLERISNNKLFSNSEREEYKSNLQRFKKSLYEKKKE